MSKEGKEDKTLSAFDRIINSITPEQQARFDAQY